MHSPLRYAVLCLTAPILLSLVAAAQINSDDVCPRHPVGSTVTQPMNLSSSNGLLEVDFTYREVIDSEGLARYCFLYHGSIESPTLRVKPGDLLILHLKNEMMLSSVGGGIAFGALPGSAPPLGGGPQQRHHHIPAMPGGEAMQPMNHGMDYLTGQLPDLPGDEDHDCTALTMSSNVTNLHLHGMNISPACHGDEVIRTFIRPNQTWEYRIQIPTNEQPGLYWYHPHPHGFSEGQVLGGASGALIVEGIEQINPEVAGLPERILVLRDQFLPNLASIAPNEPLPAKDISVNYVPVPYPLYPPAVIMGRAGESEYWRVSNSAADTYFNLALLVNGVPQQLKLIEMDGVDVTSSFAEPKAHYILTDRILLPPASRAEFVVTMPAPGVDARFVTLNYDTGPDGDEDPTRPIAVIQTSNDAPALPVNVGTSTQPMSPRRFTGLDQVVPDRERTLYFSEQLQDPSNPNSPTLFFITEEPYPPEVFNLFRTTPNISVPLGSVEDWTVENRAQEAHAFHIHQIHFQVLERDGQPVHDPELRDTIDLPYWSGQGPYPSVKLRMDFRDPDIVGTFVYHCHILGHEDSGMMGTIEVTP